VISEGVSAFVDHVSTIRRFVAALRILHRSTRTRWLRVVVHDLHRHVAVGCVDEQPDTVSPMDFPVCSFLLEPSQSPRSI
jgi:hypothetical protein